MLQIKLLDFVQQDDAPELTASCELIFGDAKVGISMWKSDFEALQEGGLFGRSHRPNKEGHRNESPVFIKPVELMDDDLDRNGASFADNLD